MVSKSSPNFARWSAFQLSQLGDSGGPSWVLAWHAEAAIEPALGPVSGIPRSSDYNGNLYPFLNSRIQAERCDGNSCRYWLHRSSSQRKGVHFDTDQYVSVTVVGSPTQHLLSRRRADKPLMYRTIHVPKTRNIVSIRARPADT